MSKSNFLLSNNLLTFSLSSKVIATKLNLSLLSFIILFSTGIFQYRVAQFVNHKLINVGLPFKEFKVIDFPSIVISF
jgi:hypothetical protein